jgi:hypothetical protein
MAYVNPGVVGAMMNVLPAIVPVLSEHLATASSPDPVTQDHIIV